MLFTTIDSLDDGLGCGNYYRSVRRTSPFCGLSIKICCQRTIDGWCQRIIDMETYPSKVIVSLSIKLPSTESSKASWRRSWLMCWISRWTFVFTKLALESLGILAELNLSIRCILASLGFTRRVGMIFLPGKAGTLCLSRLCHPKLGWVYRPCIHPITGRRATIDLSAKEGGGGTLLKHNLDKASGTNWCSSVPDTWNRAKSLSCKYIFHLNTLPVNVTLM